MYGRVSPTFYLYLLDYVNVNAGCESAGVSLPQRQRIMATHCHAWRADEAAAGVAMSQAWRGPDPTDSPLLAATLAAACAAVDAGTLPWLPMELWLHIFSFLLIADLTVV